MLRSILRHLPLMAVLFVAASVGVARASSEGAGAGSEAGASVEAPAFVEAAGPLEWYLRALNSRLAGDVIGAVDALERAHAAAPDDPDLTLELARSYDVAHLYGAAAAAFAETSVLAPERFDVALEQARFHLGRAFRVRLGAQAAERALALRPGDAEAQRLLDRARTVAALADSRG